MDEQLMAAFSFDREDLAANQAGRLSEKQEQRLKKDETFATVITAALAVLSGAGGVLILLPFVRTGQVSGDRALVLILGIVLLLVAVWAARGATTRLNFEVRKVQGKAQLMKSIQRSGSVSDLEIDRTNIVAYELVVGGRTFGVSPHLFDSVLKEGETYAVYFIESPKTLLSLEHIPSAKE